MGLDDWMDAALNERASQGGLRALTLFESKIDFVSNDYLGLARSEELRNKIHEQYRSLKNPSNGSTGSRLLAGNSELAEEVEAKLAMIFNSERTLLFSSGYTANLAALSCIPQKGDTILCDELVHACMHDGARLSKADRLSFKHNDLSDLESKLQQAKGKKFIAIESIYSMDGDECPLKEIVDLANRYQAYVILDEAHSTGVYGKNGSGYAAILEVESEIAIRIYTFGKAMGVHGACIVGSNTLISYLVNFARPFIFSTAMSPHSLISIQCAFEFLQNEEPWQQQLYANVHFFLQAYKNINHQKILSNSPIQSVLIKGNEEVKRLASYLQQHDLDCRAIRSPSVKSGSERIRICLHAYNTQSEIQKLIEALQVFR
ncbi:MAG: 8-amino-7-oxononanoate synthase [Cyclobacteriaceae bacterium]|nr:8-amino-7-oxononanoate synthase [Cyclobacteriaceae bacterium]